VAQAWKSCGVLRVSPALGAQLTGWLSAAVQAGRQKQYYDLILADHLAAAKLHVASIGSARWWEVDNEADLERAERLFIA
jgi:choline kinase